MGTAIATKPAIEKVHVKVHTGNAIWYLAQTYGDAINSLVELVQNSLDQRARHIRIVIDESKAKLQCYDDGTGASKKEIRWLWENVCLSVKAGDKKKGGEKGIGRFSGLAVAERLSITTRDTLTKGSQYFKAWIDRSELEGNAKPELSIQDLETGFALGSGLPFKAITLVAFTRIDQSSLRELSRLDEVAERISESWGERIRTEKVDVQIIFKPSRGSEKQVQVKPIEFPGRRCEPVVIKTSRGDVSFDFYVTVRPVPAPKILVIHRGMSEFPLHKMTVLWREIREMLGSGHYQGYIRLDFCTLRADRGGFIRDEHEPVFCTAVRRFVDEEVRPNYAELKSEHRLARYSETIEAAVRKIDSFFREHPTMKLMGRLAGYLPKIGANSTSDNEPEKRYRAQPPTFKESRERSRGFSSAQKPTGSLNRSSDSKIRSSVANPTGRPRHVVKSQFGITADFEEATPQTGYNWRTQVRKGVIVFNISHEDWIKRDTAGPRELQAYVDRHLVKEIAALAVSNEKAGEWFRDVFDSHFSTFFDSVC